jgi:hypothetical protein
MGKKADNSLKHNFFSIKRSAYFYAFKKLDFFQFKLEIKNVKFIQNAASQTWPFFRSSKFFL